MNAVRFQFGFDSRDGDNHATIRPADVPNESNAGVAGRWVFPTIMHRGKYISRFRFVCPTASGVAMVWR